MFTQIGGRIRAAIAGRKDYLPAGSCRSASAEPPSAAGNMATPILTLPPDPKADFVRLRMKLDAAMEFMSANFGPPPLKTFTVSPIPGTFGQGFPGLLYLSTLAYLKPEDLPWRCEPTRSAASSPNCFTPTRQRINGGETWSPSASYQDDWLMEALANYSSLLFLEKRKGRRALEEVLDEYRQHLLASGRGKHGRIRRPHCLGHAPDLLARDKLLARHYVRERFLDHSYASRVRLGEAAFLKMLNALAQRNRYGRVTTDGFRVLAAEFMPAGSDDAKFESFFEQWVYGTGIPHLKLAHSIKGKPPRVQLQARSSSPV